MKKNLYYFNQDNTDIRFLIYRSVLYHMFFILLYKALRCLHEKVSHKLYFVTLYSIAINHQH